MYTGIGASAGIGIGSAVIVKEPSLAYDNKAVSDVDAEKKRLAEALDKCIAKTQAMADDMKERVGEKEAEILDADIEKLIKERQDARKEKNFARADEIRDELAAMGIILKDTREGVKWKRA